MSRPSAILFPSICLMVAFGAIGFSHVGEPTNSQDAATVKSRIETELQAVKELSEQLHRRVQRLELLIQYQKAIDAKNESLKKWREIKVQEAKSADVAKHDAQLREKFFQYREKAKQHWRELEKISN